MLKIKEIAFLIELLMTHSQTPIIGCRNGINVWTPFGQSDTRFFLFLSRAECIILLFLIRVSKKAKQNKSLVSNHLAHPNLGEKLEQMETDSLALYKEEQLSHIFGQTPTPVTWQQQTNDKTPGNWFAWTGNSPAHTQMEIPLPSQVSCVFVWSEERRYSVRWGIRGAARQFLFILNRARKTAASSPSHRNAKPG